MLSISQCTLESGERLPLLIGHDGAPLFHPTVWSLTMRRARNVASATIAADLFALKVLYLWAETHNQQIEERILAGRYLAPLEISSLVRDAHAPLANMPASPEDGKSVRPQRCTRSGGVGHTTVASRLHSIAAYLDWLARVGIHRAAPTVVRDRTKARDEMLACLRSQMPSGGRRNVLGERESPPPAVIDRMLSVVTPASDSNPWDDIGIQVRNELLVHFLLKLGLRRGEVLSIKIENIDFQRGRLDVVRSADDPEDPRDRQPLVKTRDRRLNLDPSLSERTLNYALNVRWKFKEARKHKFLFISHHSGKPLSLAALNKLFRRLGRSFPECEGRLTPHLLRHAWNDKFSVDADRTEMPSATEQQVRSYLMGWTPTSKTAETYNRRHIRRKAEEMSLALQGTIMGKKDDEE